MFTDGENSYRPFPKLMDPRHSMCLRSARNDDVEDDGNDVGDRVHA